MPRLREMCETSFGINVFGYLTSIQSQGVLARTLVQVLREQGVPVAITDVAPDFGGTGQDQSVCLTGTDEASSQPHPISVFCFTPTDTETFLERNPRLADRDRITAVVVALEHHVLRPEFLPALEAVDLVLTLSDFITDAVSAGVPGSTCVPFRQAIPSRDVEKVERSRWGVQDRDVLFVNAFDTLSDSCRKNPLALVRAFAEAFPDRDDVALLMKIGHLGDDADLGGQAVTAVAEAAADPRVRVVQESLEYSEVLGLFASADVVVSLHRSEGLGLTLMEAMSVGTATVATRFSGNLDFMTAENSALVECELVPVRTPYPAYQYLVDRDVWAEPSHEDAVRWLRRLADEPDLRARLGDAGRADMETLRESVMGGDVVEGIKRALRSDVVWTHRDQSALKRLARPHGRLRLGVLRHRAAVAVKGVLEPQSQRRSRG
ncbi:glycosyltransferase [Nocardioides hwasunensis]|uniref:Glycosyltransferase family 4 protein n=1 Tax=Nocardioides hwasunensis TaxID=397258 RepID=A0ABR8MLW3_9ACTN|nr:glycosyltransferase [Nocardioides hwasunensis]MBD3917008.1 glycosyltransferase family 4 protein [Nocardioides hwasunensis]